MKRLIINEFEKVVSEDLTNMNKVVHQSLYDKTLYPLFSKLNGFVGDGFTPSRLSISTVQLLAGRAFYYDSSETDANKPKYKAIQLLADLTLTVGAGTWAAAPGGGSNRYDIIVIRPLESVTTTADRLVKTAGTGPIVSQTVDKISEQLYEVNVVEGTPAGSPSVPATPAGWLLVATVYQTGGSGIASAGDVVDNRVILKPSVSAYQGETRYVSALGNGTDTTLANAISNMPAAGGSIVIMEDITLSSNIVVPAKVLIRGQSQARKITFAAGGKITFSSDYCGLEKLWLVTVQAALPSLIVVSGNSFAAKDILLDLPVAGTNAGFAISGTSAQLQNITTLNADQNGTNFSFTLAAAGVSNGMIGNLQDRFEKIHTTPLTANTTLTAADTGKTFLLNSAGGAFNLTLPTPRAGLNFNFKDYAGNLSTFAVTIVRAGAESIEGVAASYPLSGNYGFYSIFSDGTNWLFKGV